MTGGIGYNLSKIEDMIGDLAKSYENLGKIVSSEWSELTGVLHDNWIGEDEQSFEATLAQKLNALYVVAHNLTQNANKYFVELGRAWYDHQQKNRLENAVEVDATPFKITTPNLTYNENLVSATKYQIDLGTNRGLTSESSASKIQSGIENFRDRVKSACSNVTETVKADEAFFGSQTSKLNDFIGRFQEKIAEVLTATKDIHEAVLTLAGSRYTDFSDSVNESLSQSESVIEQEVSQIGGRWN